jgi:MFS superfamily sulfate permease-like transporter
LPSLGGLAFIITLVILMQTAATARAFPDGEADPNVDQDYIGLGAGSILAGLVGAYPVNASPPRTAIVASAGGRSGLSSLIAAAVVMGLAAFGGGLLGHVPVAALGGVLLFIASKIFRVGEFADVLKRSPAEFGLAALTTGLIIVLPIQSGVAVGVFVSLIHGVFTITRARPILFERVAGTTVWWPATPSGRGVAAEALESVVVVGFQAPLSFLNAYDFHRGVLAEMAAAKARARLIVLEASSIVEIDFTAAGLLCDVIARAHAQGMDFAVARLESLRAADAFKRFGVLDRLGADRLFTTVDEAVRTLAPQAQP